MWIRAGRKIGRTLYQQIGNQPDDGDVCIGIVDTPEIAAQIVKDVALANLVRTFYRDTPEDKFDVDWFFEALDEVFADESKT